MSDRSSPMPEPDPDFVELYLIQMEPSLVKLAPLMEAQLNKFSDVRNVRIHRIGDARHGHGWIMRFHAPIAEHEAAWQKVLG